MEKIIGSPKVFIAASALFALATLYNVSTGAGVATNATHLTVLPNNQPTLESGPAVVHTASKPVARS
jgi:hypothetical protein